MRQEAESGNRRPPVARPAKITEEETMSMSISRIRGLFVVVSMAVAMHLVPVSPSAAQDQTSISEDRLIESIRDVSVQFESLDWNEIDLANLSFLDKALEGKRIVYLGVSDHWIHEKYDYRMILLRYLFAKGWRHIGMEMGYSDGKRVDSYLETGDEADLQRVALYGYMDDMRTDREDRPQHFPGMQNPQFRKAFHDEERLFLGRLRELNESLSPGESRLSWFGFDLTLLPGGDYVDAKDILEGHASESLIREILNRLERVQGETRAQEAKRLYGVIEYINSNITDTESIFGRTDADELIRTIRSLADSYLFCEAASGGTRSMEWILGLQKREEAMIMNADELLALLQPDDKIILMGHNLHLSKDSGNIVLGPVGSPAPRLWPTIGTHLAQNHPDEIYSIWMTYDHGRHGAVLLAEGVEEVPSDPSRIEHLFARIGSPFFLPLNAINSPYLDQERNFNQNGSTASCFLTAQADAIFFIPQVTEMNER